MARLASFEVNTVVHIAAGAKVMQPFLSSNATSQMERKPLDHIFIFPRPARGLRHRRTEKMGKSSLKEQVEY